MMPSGGMHFHHRDQVAPAGLAYTSPQLYLIFKASARTDFIEAASIPPGGMTNSDQAAEDLRA